MTNLKSLQITHQENGVVKPSQISARKQQLQALTKKTAPKLQTPFSKPVFHIYKHETI